MLDALGDAFQVIYETGGFTTGGNYKIIVGAKQKRVLEILLNNNVAPDEVFIIDANCTEIKPLKGRDFSHTFTCSH